MPSTKHGTLTEGQVDVDLGTNYRFVEVLARSGDSELWALADPPAGDASLVEQDNVDVIPATGGSVIVESTSNQLTVVRLETTGTVAWSLKGFDS